MEIDPSWGKEVSKAISFKTTRFSSASSSSGFDKFGRTFLQADFSIILDLLLQGVLNLEWPTTWVYWHFLEGWYLYWLNLQAQRFQPDCIHSWETQGFGLSNVRETFQSVAIYGQLPVGGKNHQHPLQLLQRNLAERHCHLHHDGHPFLLIGNIVILVLRLGWPGIICLLIVMLLIPFQILLGKFASSMLKKSECPQRWEDQALKGNRRRHKLSNSKGGRWPSKESFRP